MGAGSYLLEATFLSDTADVHVLIGGYSSLRRGITVDFSENRDELGVTTYSFDEILQDDYFSPVHTGRLS